MAGQKILVRNFEILNKLRGNNTTLEELAHHLGCPAGVLSSHLRLLQQQNLICEDAGTYRLSSASNHVQELLDLVQPWLDYVDNTYYEIAKDVAKIILTKSWSKVGVQDILLFGSTLPQKGIPSDIDLLICQKYTTGLFDRWTKSTTRKSRVVYF